MCLGIPGKILSIDMADPSLPMGRVDFSGAVKSVCLAYVPEAKAGDFVIVHVGFAISCLDEQEARRVFSYLDEMGELKEFVP